MSRYCNTNEMCKLKDLSIQSESPINEYEINEYLNSNKADENVLYNPNNFRETTTFRPKTLESNANQNIHFSLDNNKIFTLGLLSGLSLFVLLILAILFVLLLRRQRRSSRKNSKSDLNLYYTCEKIGNNHNVGSGANKRKLDEECSVFQYSKVVDSTSTSNSSSGTSPASLSFKLTSKQQPKINEIKVHS